MYDNKNKINNGFSLTDNWVDAIISNIKPKWTYRHNRNTNNKIIVIQIP